METTGPPVLVARFAHWAADTLQPAAANSIFFLKKQRRHQHHSTTRSTTSHQVQRKRGLVRFTAHTVRYSGCSRSAGPCWPMRERDRERITNQAQVYDPGYGPPCQSPRDTEKHWSLCLAYEVRTSNLPSVPVPSLPPSLPMTPTPPSFFALSTRRL